MTTRKWADIKAQKLTPDEIAESRRDAVRVVLEMSLRELRKMVGKTQAELAELAELEQSTLSRLERVDAPPLPTLRRYVEALGGELEVVAVLGNKRVTIAGI